MKKLLSAILAALLLLPTVAFASSTDARGAFEFCELFSQRFTEFVKDHDLNYDLYIDKGFVSPFATNDTITINVAAGLMTINKKDFTVHQLQMTLVDENASIEENEESVTVCMMAMSALECDYLDNQIIAQKGTTLGVSANAVELAISIWNNKVIPALTDETLQHVVDTKEQVLIYTGNYRYYLSYFSDVYNGNEVAYYMLTAKEYK